MQRLIFEHSPFLILLCLALAAVYAGLLYSARHSWSKNINRLLTALRFILVFFLAFLLIGPILKLTNNLREEPSMVIVVDNSASLGDVLSAEKQKSLADQLLNIQSELEAKGYAAPIKNLQNESINTLSWTGTTSDLNGTLKTIMGDYESKNLAGIILVSDGIYNSGASPLYLQTRIPTYTVGVGDTSVRSDLSVKNLAYNKIAYQGNKFTLRAEILLQELSNQNVTVHVSKGGKRIASLTKSSGQQKLLDFDFILDASEKGTQRYDVHAEAVANEGNKRNNYSTAFIDVVEGKKKILLIAPAPHPDIKALRSVIEKNSNYELSINIPGVSTIENSSLQGNKFELVIFYDVLDMDNRTKALFDQYKSSASSLFHIVGAKTNTRLLPANGIPISFESSGQQWDAVTPLVNTGFQRFNFLDNTSGIFSRFPPAEVPFGKFSFPAQANTLLFQRIGSVNTDRPLLFTWEDGTKKIAALVGHEFWRWRLNEFSERESTEYFDDVFSKLIQYLSTLDDKRRFKSFAIQNEFAEGTPVVIESQVYNDLFEIVYGNTINLQVKDEEGKQTSYSYITSPGNSRYRIGGLKEGVYQFKASTTINGQREEVTSQFVVKSQNAESQNLTADYVLLRKMAEQTGGKFYTSNQWSQLMQDLSVKEATSIIRSDESFNPLINLKTVFFLMLLLISLEWFVRKYMGGY